LRISFLFLFLFQSAMLPFCAANGFKLEKLNNESSHSKKETKADFTLVEEIEEDETEKIGLLPLSFHNVTWNPSESKLFSLDPSSRQNASCSFVHSSISIYIWVQNFRI
ncbi:MAG: hypothetical protein ACK5UE_12510, partial [Chitinophagales bacterium]